MKLTAASVQLLLLLAAPSFGGGGSALLAESARSGDLSAVTSLLAEGSDPSSAEPDGTTALLWASYHDNHAMAEALLAAGTDPDAANRNGATALGQACLNASADMVRRLLAAGADAAKTVNGEPPLLTCARSGSVEAVGRLLEASAEIDQPESWRGQTALMWAAAEDHAAVVRLLLARGANVTAQSESGWDALAFAVRQEARSSAALLIEAGADVNRPLPNGQSLLQMAIRNQHYSLAQALLASSADPRATDKGGRTALHDLIAAREPPRRRRAPEEIDPLDSIELLGSLLAHGADPNAATPPGKRLSDEGTPSAIRPIIDNAIRTGRSTPVLLAARAADVEAMRSLLDGGADPTLVTAGGTSALMFAAGLVFVEGSRPFRSEADSLAAARLAIELGLDANAVNEHGQTALHGAVYRASNEIISALVNAGAKPDLEDEHGRTPLDLAEQGFNQVSSIIRREPAAELLRTFAGAIDADPQRRPTRALGFDRAQPEEISP
ncbi:MAG: ankyrin repeat domain-containing protein [Acidobacteriota bacterium]|nr:ankyrin repeat domain-containing protein [Acidobacteriota bacterium]